MFYTNEDRAMRITVLRIGHRPLRDKRLTTHLLLCARALGAEKAIYSGERDRKIEETIDKVVDDWGGRFSLDYTDKWKKTVYEWEGKIIHLTMYGFPVQKVISEIKNFDESLLVIVGGPKVPAELYELSDWNLSVTSQPHSEVSALAIFLHILFEGKELEKEFPGAKMIITPSLRGKDVRYLG
jgi:tRNA (cytidine56-2'-O)-methyltransferase